jgi:hypothetical protein
MMTRVVNKFETSLIDNARVVIYDYHMFIVQATGSMCGLFYKYLMIAILLGPFKSYEENEVF